MQENKILCWSHSIYVSYKKKKKKQKTQQQNKSNPNWPNKNKINGQTMTHHNRTMAFL